MKYVLNKKSKSSDTGEPKVLKQAKTSDAVHKGFEIGLLLKLAGGIFELIGAVLMLFITPGRMSAIVRFFTRNELVENTKGFFIRLLLSFSNNFTVSAQHFDVFYLASHGIIKLMLVYLLWRKKLWAYPLTVAFLVIFVIYQVIRISVRFSVPMLLLTIFDIIMIALTMLEYKRVKAERIKLS